MTHQSGYNLEKDQCAAFDYSLIKMNKIILHGLALLLLCGVAQSMTCFDYCKGDPCVPIFCKASGDNKCFTNQIQEAQGTMDEEDDVYISLLDLETTGCTSEANRHLCDTVRIGKLSVGNFKIRLQINMTCCNPDFCNYTGNMDVPQQ